MSPRKARYEVEKHIVSAIRTKKKMVQGGPYLCPQCNNESLRIRVTEDKILIRCRCGLKEEMEITKSQEPIDHYNDFLDNYYT